MSEVSAQDLLRDPIQRLLKSLKVVEPEALPTAGSRIPDVPAFCEMDLLAFDGSRQMLHGYVVKGSPP